MGKVVAEKQLEALAVSQVTHYEDLIESCVLVLESGVTWGSFLLKSKSRSISVNASFS